MSNTAGIIWSMHGGEDEKEQTSGNCGDYFKT